ncbi:hypothetical protein [Deinococcus misasensis]|uniref:hypothetical protein n=1 Tax=Deinococcus misasensis TaxID=392413 RepID=UPI000552A105|nr:hypothetical protein [Deinococcus misasensis]
MHGLTFQSAFSLPQSLWIPGAWDSFLQHNSRQLERELLKMDTEIARIRLAQLYIRQQKGSEAAQTLQDLHHVLARAERLRLMHQQGQHDAVLEAGLMFLQNWNGATDLLEAEAHGRMCWMVGLALAEQGNLKARGYLESAASTFHLLGINHSQVMLDLALNLLKLGDHSGSVGVYRQVMGFARKNRDARMLERALIEGCAALICAGECDLDFVEGLSNKMLRVSFRNLLQAVFQRTPYSETPEEPSKPRDVFAALTHLIKGTERAFQEFHLGHFGDARRTCEKALQAFDVVQEFNNSTTHHFEVLYAMALYLKGLCGVIVRDQDVVRDALQELGALKLQNPLVRCLRGVLCAEMYSVRRMKCPVYSVQQALQDVFDFFAQAQPASQQFMTRWLLRFGIGVLVVLELLDKGNPSTHAALSEVMFITPLGAFLNFKMINHPSAGAISQSLYEILEVHRAQEPKHEMQIYRHRLTMRENLQPPITFSLIVDHLLEGSGCAMEETSDLMYLKRFLPEKYQKLKEPSLS